MGDLDTKVAEYKQKAEKCDLPTTRGPAMDAYVIDSIKGDGTNSITGNRVMTSKQAYCMGVPGAVDEPSAADRLKGWFKSQYNAAVEAVGASLEDVKKSQPARAAEAAAERASEGWKEYSGANKTQKTLEKLGI